jgi:hypothetical protein
MTLVELMIAMTVGSMLVAAATSLWLFGSRSFLAMGNYSDLDNKSRNALDRMSQNIRQATAVIAFQKNNTTTMLTVTNAVAGVASTYIWQATPRTLVCKQTGQPSQVYLTECDRWDFELYQRTPQTGGRYVFFPATNTAGAYDLSVCKLIDMTWKCSRNILGKKVNTESVQTAQVVLRNKQ